MKPMGQQDVLKIVQKYPRRFIREISELLNWNVHKTSTIVHKMLGYYLEAVPPTEEELDRILNRYPGTRCNIRFQMVYVTKDV